MNSRQQLTILFLHGWRSIVGGVKPTYLQQCGHRVVNPALDDDDFDEACMVAQEAFDRCRPDVVVGSSRGGAVAMSIQTASTPLVLLCPAWKKWGGRVPAMGATWILHSRKDEVIPFDDSLELLQRSGLTTDCLFETGSDHRLADPESLAVMEWACRQLASGIALPDGEVADLHCAGDDREDRLLAIHSNEDSSYICDGCGEEIVIPLDISEGASQSYVEDCPVCCRANVIHVDWSDDSAGPRVWAEPEQDRD